MHTVEIVQQNLDFLSAGFLVKRWYVARARPSRIRDAMTRLRAQGFDSYFPFQTIERVRNRKVVSESEPLFHGYVFVGMELTVANWRAVNGTRGIIRLLSFKHDGEPSPVPQGEVEALMDKENKGLLKVSELTEINRGDLVRIKVGPLADQLAQVKWTRGERVGLLFKILGGTTSLVAPKHTLAVVASSKAPAVRQPPDTK